MVWSMILAATLTLPMTEVKEVAYFRDSVFPGRVVPIAKVNIVPQVSGEILEVAFDNGAVVSEGEVLYRIDPVKYEAAVKNAESKLQEMKANVKYAELSYERHKNLLETRAVSLDAVDNALSQRDSSRAALAAAQADLVAARDDLEHCTIRAPISGKMGTTAKTKGNYAVKESEVLVTLVKASPIRVRFSISNREYLERFAGRTRKLKEQAKVVLTLANGEVFDEVGEVEYVDNSSDEATDTVMVYVVFQNASRKLKAGGTVLVRLSSVDGVMRPAIPPTAVLQDTQGSFVWVIDAEGCARRRQIARGELKGDWLFVEKGLKAGEVIVADGAHRARAGDKIEAVK